jgi:hemolysin III
MQHGERFNAITHLVGTILALAGLVVLVAVSSMHRDPWRIASVSIYGVSLVVLYTSSTLYHSVSGRAKRVFRHLDHTAIYLLIAGSYTPFTLVSLRGRLGWWMFVTVWALAGIGALQEFRKVKGERVLSVVIYVIMGWLAIVALGPLIVALGPGGLAWLMAGGFFYTTGIAFYALDHKVPAFHGIWHLFVLAGSLAHFVVILGHVA